MRSYLCKCLDPDFRSNDGIYTGTFADYFSLMNNSTQNSFAVAIAADDNSGNAFYLEASGPPPPSMPYFVLLQL